MLRHCRSVLCYLLFVELIPWLGKCQRSLAKNKAKHPPQNKQKNLTPKKPEREQGSEFSRSCWLQDWFIPVVLHVLQNLCSGLHVGGMGSDLSLRVLSLWNLLVLSFWRNCRWEKANSPVSPPKLSTEKGEDGECTGWPTQCRKPAFLNSSDSEDPTEAFAWDSEWRCNDKCKKNNCKQCYHHHSDHHNNKRYKHNCPHYSLWNNC